MTVESQLCEYYFIEYTLLTNEFNCHGYARKVLDTIVTILLD